MLVLPCTCICHHHCHLCGREFVGPNDVHTNCADTVQPKDDDLHSGIYTTPDPLEAWPVDPDDFKGSSVRATATMGVRHDRRQHHR